MTFNFLNRKVHYWTAAISALPVLVILTTGLLLQLKKQLAWVQPPERRGIGKTPTRSLDELLAAVRSVPAHREATWESVSRMDVRPSKGIAKVTLKDDWEVQVDLETGKVLQSAYRRSDIIETLHDGSFFHEKVKLWVFLPSAAVLLTLWVTGIYLFALPLYMNWSRRRNEQRASRPIEKAQP